MDNLDDEEDLFLPITLEYPMELIIDWLTFAHWEGKTIGQVLGDALRNHIEHEPSTYVPVPPKRQANFDVLIEIAKALRKARKSAT